jgi:hypothetical protein
MYKGIGHLLSKNITSFQSSRGWGGGGGLKQLQKVNQHSVSSVANQDGDGILQTSKQGYF